MDFLSFAAAHGLEISHLEPGRIVRCRTSDHRTKKNGAYLWEGDFGFVQNWAVHDKPVIWITDKEVDQVELHLKIKKSREKYNQERARVNEQAIRKAKIMLTQCRNDTSAYLASKGFPDMCFNMLHEQDKDPLLCVPMRINGRISGLQTIAPDGVKKFIYGTNASLATFDIGQGDNVFLVEGLATSFTMQKIAATLKLPYTIRVCFSAGNMGKVAKLHDNPILIADNDSSGTGERVAIESGKRYYIPPIVDTDVNDECNQTSYFIVSQKIKKMLYSRL